MRKILIAMSVFAAILPLKAFPAAELLDFRLSQLTVLQEPVGNTFSGMLSWNPGYSFTDWFAFRTHFGVTQLMGTRDTFTATEYRGLLSFTLGNHYVIEAGGGAQTWINYGGTFPIFSGDLGYRFDPKILWIIERFFAGYTGLAIKDKYTHEIRAGVGIRF